MYGFETSIPRIAQCVDPSPEVDRYGDRFWSANYFFLTPFPRAQSFVLDCNTPYSNGILKRVTVEGGMDVQGVVVCILDT